jgi:hypothetical protein
VNGTAERFERAVESIEADRAVDIVETYAVIEGAAEAGNAMAARLAGYAAGVGYGRSIDLAAAVAWLRRAAERGDDIAQAQFAFLVPQEELDIAAWTCARAIRIVHEQPHIGVSDGFIDAALSGWLIERARPLQEAALVYDPQTGHPVGDDLRSNTSGTFKLCDLDLPLILIRHRIANTIGAPIQHFERTSVFRYQTGQTFADHADYISTAFSAEIRQRGQRPFTFLVYLNDDFEGGETHFLGIDKKLRGGVGDALFWRNVDENGAPDECTHHAGLPPTRGEKWLLSQFIRDKPQMPG